MANLSQKAVSDIVQRSRRMWELEHYVALSDCPGARDIAIRFNPQGNMSFHDPVSKLIVIGVSGAVDMWDINDEKLLHGGVRLLRIHEAGHLRYTASEPYIWGINRGTEIIIEEIAKIVMPHPMKFRKDSDYEWFLKSELGKRGIVVNVRGIKKFVRFAINSLEDGRIERILANRYPGFEKLRVFYRGITWEKDKFKFTPEDVSADPSLKLRLLMKEVLTLSTIHVHNKGFEVFNGTEEATLVNSMMDSIYMGIAASTTREMVEDGLFPICRLAAPTLFEVLSREKSDVDNILEDIIRDAIKNIVDQMEEGNVGVSERDAESDDSPFEPAFPETDLEVTLPDETYDKLMEKLKDKGSDGDGIRIKREHPLENEDESESEPDDDECQKGGSKQSEDGEKSDDEPESEANGGGSSDCGDGEQQTGGNGKSEETDEEDDSEDGGSAGTGGKADDEPDEKSQDGSEGEKGSESEKNDTMKGNGLNSDTDDETRDSEDDPHCGNETEEKGQSENHEKSGGNGEPVRAQQKRRTELSSLSEQEENLKSIEDAMREAAESIISDANTLIDTINQTVRNATSASKKFAKETPATSPVLTPEDVKDVYGGKFKEFTRKYHLTEHLPPDLEAKGRTAHSQYEQWARNKKRPVSRFKKEGKIDPRNIYRLGVKRIDAFMKDAAVDEFNGCAYILIDNSGSMSGAKRMAACRAAAVQEEAFMGMFPFKIVAFDENFGTITHEVVKDWNETHPATNCCWNFALRGRQGCGNADEHDIRIATKELLNRHEKKKLLIVLSDGAPDDCEDTKRAISEARKQGVTVFGIYFEEGELDERYSRFFVDMYEKDYVLCEIEEIEKHLSTLMSRFFKS